jgi:hypothetical protein
VTVAELAGVKEKAVAATEAEALAQARTILQMERRVIMETEIEAADARIAGNPALAVKLEREADIRTRALGIQRALNVSTEESIVLAEKLVLAQEASAVATNTMGINMAKAKTEALVLGREMAAGNVRASTLSSLLGSLGTTLTIAGIGAYELYETVSHVADEVVALSNEYKKQTNEIEKQVSAWLDLAKAAGDAGDTLKLAQKIVPDLQAMQVKLADFRAKELEQWRGWGDALEGVLRSSLNAALSKIPSYIGLAGGVGSLGISDKTLGQTAAEDAAEQARQLAAGQLAAANSAVDVSKRYAAEVARIGELMPREQITIYSQKVNELQAELDVLDTKRGNSVKDFENWEKKAAELNLYKGRLEEAGDAQDKLNKKAADSTRRSSQQELNALLREHASLVSTIHQQQELINANPFLSVDDKQKLLFVSMTAELLEMGSAIAATKEKLAGSVLDPAEHARLQADLQKDTFEFERLKLKVQSTTFGGQVGAELVSWVNSFGTAAHQVAEIITSVLGAAIDGLARGISGLVLGTETWQQAWNSAVATVPGNY